MKTELAAALAAHDWEKSHPLDLSDAALLADLAKRQELSPDKLVLYEDADDWNDHKHHKHDHDHDHKNGNGRGSGHHKSG